MLIRRTTRLQDDAAIGIVLSVFFGLGICLLSFIQQMPTGNAAGLETFIFGKAATMLSADARIIGVASLSGRDHHRGVVLQGTRRALLR